MGIPTSHQASATRSPWSGADALATVNDSAGSMVERSSTG